MIQLKQALKNGCLGYQVYTLGNVRGYRVYTLKSPKKRYEDPYWTISIKQPV